MKNHLVRSPVYALQILAFALAYFVSGKLGIYLSIPPGYATAVWPPSGIALAGILIFGYRAWPSILLGSILVNYSTSFSGGTSAEVTLSFIIIFSIGIGAALQAVTGAYLLRRFAKFPNQLASEKEVLSFMFVGGVLSTIINCSISVITLVVAGRIPLSNAFANWCVWWAGDAMGVFIFTPLVLVWALRPAEPWRNRRIAISLTILIAFALTTALAYYSSHQEKQALQHVFETDSRALSTMLEKSIFLHLDALHSIQSFYSASNSVDKEAFKTFTESTLNKFNGIQALSWNPHLSSSERVAFERTMRKQLGKDFKVSERDSAKQLIRAGNRAEYVPVSFIVPAKGNEQALGYDVYSDGIRREAINRARDSGDIATTARITLVQEHGSQFGVLLFMPIYRNGASTKTITERRSNIKGYAVGVFRGGDIVLGALKDSPSKNLAYRLTDASAPAGEQLLFSTDSTKDNKALPVPTSQEKNLLGYGRMLNSQTNINMGGRNWQFEVIPTQAYLAEHYTRGAWYVLMLGFLLTSITSVIVLILSDRGNALKRLVDERTLELQKSYEHLYKLAQQVPGVLYQLTISADGHYSFPYVSESIRDVYEVTSEQVRDDGGLIFTMLHPDDYEAYLGSLQESARDLKSWEIEYRVNLPKQGLQWLYGQAHPEILADGSVLWHGFIHNISERKRNEENLYIAAAAFETNEGIMVTDANKSILRVNSAFTTITGYSAEDVIGQTPNVLSSGRQSQEFYDAMWEKINDFGVWEGEIWNRRKSGEHYPEQLTITAVKDVTGAVTNYVASMVDITISKAASEEIMHLASYDLLTQLPNRRLLLDRLKHALASSARSGQRGALLFMDLDHFKSLNDTLGHDVGDLLLQQVAERLTVSLRGNDTVSRLGGDEFVVLLEGLSEQAIEAAAQARDITEKILLSLNQPYQLNAHTHHSTSSIGVSLFSGHDVAIDELLKQADIAMYQSKTEGRNTFMFFDTKMQEAITTHVKMDKELRKAIEQNQFELYYQVQVDSSGQTLGAEVLIRWIHPERGMIPPFSFIPLAEESGLILPIGQWVLDTACAQLKTWQQTPLTKDLVLAVNVSALQFNQKDFVAQVLATVARHDINPARLKLELTESMLADNINDIIAKMDTLSKIGIRFSLDDFGTGYSSLQYLKKLPLSQLKIDQSFVRDIVADASDRAIVRTIVTMAHSLDIDVIAEGVETEEQYEVLLAKEGCTNFQGYLFGKPMPIDEFEALLSKVK